jgi:hypothetical protein
VISDTRRSNAVLFFLHKSYCGGGYTFALEWFGDKELQLPEELMQEILSHTTLNLEYSMGYGIYIKKQTDG